MSQVIIDISSPNDGLGDPLRFAFDQQNGMNTELYGSKVDKVTGQGLSDNNFTDAEQTKLAGIAAGAEVNVQPDWNQTDNTQDDYIKNKPSDVNSMGWFMYNDLATQTTPISFLTGVDKKLTNDALGAGTQSTYAPFGVSSIWDAGATNQLNLSQLNVGDIVNMRVLVETTTTSANQTYNIKLKSSIGSPVEMLTNFLSDSTKTAGTKQQAVSVQIAVSSIYARDYPSEFYIGSDGNGTIKIKGFYFSIIRKGLNIIDLSNTATLQDITDNGATTTNPVTIGDASTSLTIDTDKITVNPFVGIDYDVFFPTPETPGDDVVLVSSEQVITALEDKEDIVNKGLPGGYAELDLSGVVPASQLPPFAFSNTIVSNVQSGTSYTLVDGDNAKQIITTNSSPVTITIPTGLITGFNCEVYQQGTGKVTVVASGTTLRYTSFELPSLIEQFTLLAIDKVPNVSETFHVYGQLTLI